MGHSRSRMDQPHKHLLVAGSTGTGKTTLMLQLARGVFLPVVPKRFEGWTMVAAVPEPSMDVLAAVSTQMKKSKKKVSRATSYGFGTNSSTHSSYHPANASFTLWEDWSRKIHSNEPEEDEENVEEDEAEPDGGTSIKDREKAKPPTIAMLNQNGGGCLRPGAGATHPYNGANTELIPFIARCHSLDDAVIVKPHEPCVPLRPFLAPTPDVILLCYSVCDIDSFREAEEKIHKDLTERFPNTPIILVGTKCDLREDESEVVSLVDRRLMIPETHSTEDVANPRLGSTRSLDDRGLVMVNHPLPTKFMIPTQNGFSMAKRIKASAFYDCSAKSGTNISNLLGEVAHILHYGMATSAPSMALAVALSQKGSSKKHSAPMALFHGSSSKTRSTVSSVYKSKAASFNFIKGSMTNIYHSATKD